jgi:hypothetical protein
VWFDLTFAFRDGSDSVMGTNRRAQAKLKASSAQQSSARPRLRRNLLEPTQRQLLMLGTKFAGRLWQQMPRNISAADRWLIANTRFVEVGKDELANHYRLSRSGAYEVQNAQEAFRIVNAVDAKVREQILGDLISVLEIANAGGYGACLIGETLFLPSDEARGHYKLFASSPLQRLKLSSGDAPRMIWEPGPAVRRACKRSVKPVIPRRRLDLFELIELAGST